MSRILIIDDEAGIRLTLGEGLKDFGHQVKAAKNSMEAYKVNSEFSPELIILDLNLGFENGLDLIESLRESNPNVQIIILTAYGDIKSAVTAVKKGVFDFLNKPFDIDELQFIIEKALDMKIMKNKIYLHEKEKQLNKVNFIGESHVIRNMLDDLLKVARMNDVTVLIRGESGTGKELAAEYVYSNSPRADKPYVKVNCAALPANLVESELFGYVKGAFTGADKEKIGLIEAASEGTIFLDEIGEISTEVQAKLLRVLESKKLMRVGSVKEIPVDVRVIAATNKDLVEAIKQGEFREDLYYRLNVFPVNIPPLRERIDDLGLLIRHFLKVYSAKFGKKIEASDSFIEAAGKYSWPGNVRELSNIIERLCILSSDRVLKDSDFTMFSDGDRGLDKAIKDFDLPEGFDLEEEVARIEKGYITEAMEMSGSNVSKAADLLNMSRYSLMRRLEKYGLN
ncbi:DNA-binding transcriptional response regulator, NtrC family, contains REC, AAA-type ATPase, and a Fis-type DNA-binding domains [Dethiosulfatibacter aminovorans DSM 17477]|uniref:DNA-binding transcriptional response regulator, NtrC family, contains REC, AAA-type ATPase, and a Fis-type DNA-binding domains n=1 Tax=Dethiosulfatibacter aminovorans DSM 17477 TaxID=1121476 RepID=A0A1M6HDQ4_9FIRM|nr:sigma-54 dependent transcriptional regulator [Dethiosulfatibacter aminovorans]SHJ20350.1 DNA-binding transcriptional response regulator, NtrC family, contains REC, AAA-type ATPase, and a Fis-type DNA-binding domains [Dethiosulfatibacter aminovorans DSM 17477]